MGSKKFRFLAIWYTHKDIKDVTETLDEQTTKNSLLDLFEQDAEQ